jgi:hypothetical protein
MLTVQRLYEFFLMKFWIDFLEEIKANVRFITKNELCHVQIVEAEDNYKKKTGILKYKTTVYDIILKFNDNIFEFIFFPNLNGYFKSFNAHNAHDDVHCCVWIN